MAEAPSLVSVAVGCWFGEVVRDSTVIKLKSPELIAVEAAADPKGKAQAGEKGGKGGCLRM